MSQQFSIARLFGGAPAQQVPQNLPPQVTNNPATNAPPPQPHRSAQTDANGVIPQKPAEPESPTAKFKDVWEAPKTEEPNPNAAPELTPEKMMEAASKVDFTKVLDQATMSKIAAGGEDAVQAFAAALNKVAQTSYGQSLVVAKKMIENELGKAREDFSKQVPSLVRRQAARDTLLTDNPAFKDPAVAPVVAAIQQTLEQKYPNASPSEIAQLSKDWMAAAAGVFAPQKPSNPQPAGADEEDWESWASK